MSKEEEQEGEGLLDIIDRIKAFFNGPRNNYSPSVRTLISSLADKKITSMQVCRSPIQSVIQKIVDLVSIKTVPFDKLFHLYGLVKLDNGSTYRFEKNQVIEIAKYGQESDSECVSVPLNKEILFGEFLMKSQTSGGADYFKYDGFTNNCQDFILTCLRANSLLSSELNKFIKQDVKNLVPSLIEKLGKKATDLAAAADVLVNGEGMMRGYGLVSTSEGVRQIGFIAT